MALLDNPDLVIRLERCRDLPTPPGVAEQIIGLSNDPNSDIVKLLRNRKFFFQKEESGTLPKLFYLVPEDEKYAKQSIPRNTKIYTWKDIEARYRQAAVKRSKDWKV